MALDRKLTNSQYWFLRCVRRHPEGVPMSHWPRAATLRRWMRRPLFVRAMITLRETLRFESDFILAGTATRAAKLLSGMLDEYNFDGEHKDFDKRATSLVRVLRAEHSRQRETKRAAIDRDRLSAESQALSAVREVTATRRAAIAGTTNEPAGRAMAARASKLLVDVWGTFDQLLAEEGAGREAGDASACGLQPARQSPEPPMPAEAGTPKGISVDTD